MKSLRMKKKDRNNKEEKVQEKISKIEELLEEMRESKQKKGKEKFEKLKEKEAEEEPEEENEDKDNNKGKKVKDRISFSDKFGWFMMLGSIILLIFILYFFIFKNLNLNFDFKIPELGEKTSLFLLFFAGILTGFHCIAMCGGFVVSYTAKNALNGHKSFKQHLVYGGSKVVSYTIIGGIFGLIGGVIAFSVGLRSWVAVLAGLFMIFYSLSMFGIKFFRKFQFNPKFLTRFASKESGKFNGVYSRPMITGLLNGLFIACGPLQAMYLYAMGTGSFISGATSLAAFGLGTLPIMLGFGSLASVISHKTTKKILKISAIIVLVLGLIMLNRGLALTGSSFSYDSFKAKIIGGTGGESAILKGNIQEINMEVSASGYSPNSFVIKKGIPVKWNINVPQLFSCTNELIMNAYGIDVHLKQGLNVVEFTPDKIGTIQFTCGMGMLRGSFIVTETGQASQEEVKAATPSAGASCSMGGGGCGCGG